MIAFIALASLFLLFIFALWRFKFKARYLPTLAIVVMLLGIFALCQPWSAFVYRYGFGVLIMGVLAYNVVSHFEQQ